MRNIARRTMVAVAAVLVMSTAGLYGGMAHASAAKSCTITVTNNQTGQSYTITVHGVSCSELIQQVMK